MGVPQVIWIVLMSLVIASNVMEHGEYQRKRTNAWDVVVGVGINAGLLWWGGFFG